MLTQERKSRLVTSVNKLHAYQEIQNEVARMIIAVNFGQADRVLDRLALDRPDVSVEIADEGVFTGPEAVTAIINETVGKEAAPGEMVDLQLTTPAIEVADDLESAHATWWIAGAGSIVPERGDPEAIWLWGTLAADLVPESDSWKVWHLH